MSDVTVQRENIKVEARTRESHAIGHFDADLFIVGWEATLDGCLSTGEHVYAEVRGKTAVHALSILEAVIREQGWEIRR